VDELKGSGVQGEASPTSCWAGPLGAVSALLRPSWLTALPAMMARGAACDAEEEALKCGAGMMARADAASERTYPSAEASRVLHLRGGGACVQTCVREWLSACMGEHADSWPSPHLPSGLSIPALMNIAPRLGVRMSLIPHTNEASESPA
jgi:hypothetical protein